MADIFGRILTSDAKVQTTTKNLNGEKQMKYCIIDCGEGIHIHTRRRRSNLSDRRAGMTIIRHGEFFGTTIDRRDALRMVRAARRAGVAKLFRD